MKRLWPLVLLSCLECLVQSLKTRERKSKLQTPSCPDDPDLWCSRDWRDSGAYKEEDCNNDGVLDRICDTHGIDVESTFQNKRWIKLSGDCDAFNAAAGDAPKCKDIAVTLAVTLGLDKDNLTARPSPTQAGLAAATLAQSQGESAINIIDAAYRAARATAMAADHATPDAEASRVAAQVAERIAQVSASTSTTTTTITTTSAHTPALETCGSVGVSVCSDDQVFQPNATCGGALLSSCTAESCCVQKALCGSAVPSNHLMYVELVENMDRRLCDDMHLLMEDAVCAGTSPSSCDSDLCCVPKTTCAAASPALCAGKGELLPGHLCLGTDASTCKVEECCAMFPKCELVEPMCDEHSVFAPQNACIDGDCNAQACCLPRTPCLAANKEVECPPGSKFHPEGLCGVNASSCSKDTCCTPLQTCGSFDASRCNPETTVFARYGFCQGECHEGECCLHLERCAGLETNPCSDPQRFVPDNLCSGSSLTSCDANTCCAKESLNSAE